MCGITGVVRLRDGLAVDPELVRAMNQSLAHRGPDGDGFHFSPGVGLGHRRLSIIDLEGGAQPVYNEDRSVVVTYNGEIYNFAVLREQLVALGHVFVSRCDTEVIVHAWEEWGARCVERFNGMFAFGLWDENQQTLFLARDRVGIKPLYYTVKDDNVLSFASELKALGMVPGALNAMDPRAVDDYFTFGYIPDPKTIWMGVNKLPPGTTLLCKRGEPLGEPVRYWDIPLDKPPTGGDELPLAELREQLSDAVSRRLVADVPLGAFLSGGIDSSAVVAVMRELGVPTLETCSIGFSEAQYDESEFARQVAIEKQTNHHAEVVQPFGLEMIDTLDRIYDEPFADSSSLPTYAVCGLAKKHVTVCLSGDGGDESFIGYRRYRMLAGEERVRRLIPKAIRKPLFSGIGALYPKADWAPRVLRGKATFEALALDSAMAYLKAVSIFEPSLRRSLFSERFIESLGGYSSDQVFTDLVEGRSFSDPMRMAQYLDFHTYLPGDILTKVDRASMAHSLEVRVPFLDHQFLEWACSVPTVLKLHRGEGKYVLKKALEPWLPSNILYRKKMGFAVPLDIWFRGELHEDLTDRLEAMGETAGDLFNMDVVRQLLFLHKSGRRNFSAVLWALLMFSAHVSGSGARTC